MSIELEGTARPLTQKIVEEDPELNKLFGRLHPAIVFVTKPLQIPGPIQTDATLAALKVIDTFRQGRRSEARERIATRKKWGR